MNILVFAVSLSILYVCILATPHPEKWRVKRADTNSSRYIASGNEDRTTAKAVTLRNTLPAICSTPTEADSGSGRSRRSIQHPFSNLTTTELPEYTINISILSDEFLNCTHINIEPECYERLPNSSVYVPLYDMMFDISNYIINQELLFICPEFFNEFTHIEKFSYHIPIVSLTCTCVSAFCIILHILMFIFVKKLRNLPGYCLLSLCVALLSAYLCSFIQYAVSDYMGCTVIGMLLLYFFLASFFWMNTMAYDVWKSIRLATAKLRLTTNRPIMVQFGRYCLYGWGTPLAIIFISIIIHHSSLEDSKFRLTFNISDCWFKYKQALTLYFAGPLFILLGMNVVFFTSSFYMIMNAAISKSQSGSQGGSDLWYRLFLSLRLASVMGFMWIFGILAAVTKQEWLWYLYSSCSALQGVFIFFSFTVSERTRKLCRAALRSKTCSQAPTQTSSHHMSSV